MAEGILAVELVGASLGTLLPTFLLFLKDDSHNDSDNNYSHNVLVINSTLVVLTVTMWPPLASHSVFMAIKLGSENNCIILDFSLKLKAYMNLKRDSMNIICLFYYQIIPCFV